MILNFFFLKNINLKISFNNIIIFNSILKSKYKPNYSVFLNFPQNSKYNWCTNFSIRLKFINLNFINIINADNFFISLHKNSDKVNNIIFFKKKSIMFKKSSEFEFNILNRSNHSRDSFYTDGSLHVSDNIDNSEYLGNDNNNLFFLPKNIEPKYNETADTNYFNYKTVDFKRKINLVFKQNRVLLRKFLKVKFKRKNTFNKYIKNLTKLDQKSFLYNFEYRLVNLLTRSSFFFNYNDCIWFLKNGYVTINGVVVYNEKKILKPLQIVNLSHNNYFFFYYRYMLDNCISNLYKFNMKIWKINNQKSAKKKKKEEKYPSWVYRYMYYKEDVPKFIEVDYISMTMVLLNYPFNKNYFDFYNIKFLNLYLNRIYNWKCVI